MDHSSNDVITQAWYGLCGRVNVTFEKRNSHYHCPCGGALRIGLAPHACAYVSNCFPAPFPCKHVHLALAFTEVNAPLRVSWLSQGTAATATSKSLSRYAPPTSCLLNVRSFCCSKAQQNPKTIHRSLNVTSRFTKERILNESSSDKGHASGRRITCITTSTRLFMTNGQLSLRFSAATLT